MHTESCFREEPDDLVSQTISALATAVPYTELATVPAYEGVGIIRGVQQGVFFARRPDTSARAFEAVSGRKVRLGPNLLLFAYTVAGFTGATLYVECYRLRRNRKEDWKELNSIANHIGGNLPSLPSFPPSQQGTDVTLGTFSDSGGGTQVFKAATNMPIGGATIPCEVFLNTPGTNTDSVFAAETSALAVASNSPIQPSGQDTWRIPAGGKLFILANSGTQKVGARVRS